MTARGRCKNGGHVARREMVKSDGEGVNINNSSVLVGASQRLGPSDSFFTFFAIFLETLSQ